MTLARDIMTPRPQCIGVNDALSIAAELMSAKNVGALPICGEDRKLKGMLTDRDIVVKAIAHGLNPETTPAGALATGTPITVVASDDVSVALERMQHHQIRRIPVIDNQQLVGMLSQADIARALSAKTTGEVVESVSTDHSHPRREATPMSNPLIPPLPTPDSDDDRAAEPEAIMTDDDGEQVLDPDMNDKLIDSADADRLAAGGEPEHGH